MIFYFITSASQREVQTPGIKGTLAQKKRWQLCVVVQWTVIVQDSMHA